MTITHNGFTFESANDGLIRMIERNLNNGRLSVTVELKALTEAGGVNVIQHTCNCVKEFRDAKETVANYGSEACIQQF